MNYKVMKRPMFRLGGDVRRNYENGTSLEDLIKHCREIGAVVFNPHVVSVEDGGLGVVDVDQVEAKRRFDPDGIMNPGKLKGWL